MSQEQAPRPGESVLPRIERQVGSGVRIALRGAEGAGAGAAAAGEEGPAEGKYLLHDELGRGGVGVVLRGSDVDLGREVAIKVLREEHQGSMDVIKRFVEEAQIGGQLQHPGVVPVYDLGMRGGRPFFAMRLVRGKSLAELLAAREHPRRERRRFLGIFEQVCQALGYAHTRGVIHRDLKPANVMVGAFGEVQVVDWGMGKVLDRAGPEPDGSPVPDAPHEPMVETVRSESTDAQSELGSMMGTPGYLPPEQARGRVGEIDERSDVFALGAMLLEILTGEPAQVGSPIERVQTAFTWDPEEALQRLAPFAVDETLVALVRDCLQPEREARPASARALADRMAAYLSAVEERAQAARIEAAEARTQAAQAEAREAESRAKAAREEARAEKERAEAEQARLRAEAERKRRIALVLVGVALLVGVVGTTLGMLEAETQRKDAVAAKEAEAERAEGERKANKEATRRLAQVQKGNEILGAIFEGLDPEEVATSGVPLQVVIARQLDEAVAQLEGDAIGDPGEVARMQLRLAGSYIGLGEHARSTALLEKVRAHADAHLAPDDDLALSTLSHLATAHSLAGEHERAVDLHRESLERIERARGTEHPLSLRAKAALGAALQGAGRDAEAQLLLEEVVPLLRTHAESGDPGTLHALASLADVYAVQGRHALALPLVEEVARLTEAHHGPDHPHTITSLVTLSAAQLREGQVELALPTVQEAYERARRLLGAEHPLTVRAMHQRAAMLREAGRAELALSLVEEELRLTEARHGPGAAETLQVMNNLAASYWSVGKLDKSIPLFETVARRREALFGRDQTETQRTLMNLGVNYASAGRVDEALPLLEEVMRHAREQPGLLEVAGALAVLYARTQQAERGRGVLEEALALAKARWPEEPLQWREIQHKLAVTYFRERRLDLSIPLFEELLARDGARLGPDHPEVVFTRCNLAQNHALARNGEDARRLNQEAVASYEKDPGLPNYATTHAMRLIGGAFAALNRVPEAIAQWEQALAAMAATGAAQDADPMGLLGLKASLAGLYTKNEQHEKAIASLEDVLEGQKRRWGETHVMTLRATGELGMALLESGRSEEALPLLEQAFEGRMLARELAALRNPLARAYEETDQPAKGVALLEEVLPDARRTLPAESPQLAGLLARLGMAHLRAGQHSQAETILRECLGIREKVLPDDWSTSNARALLGAALLGLDRTAEAEPLLLAGVEDMLAREASIPEPGRPRVAEAMGYLIGLYEKSDRADEASAWRARLEARSAAGR